MRYFIWILLLPFWVHAQDAPQLELSLDEKDPSFRYNLTAKVSVTPRCDLMIMIDSLKQSMWFVEVVKPKTRTQNDVTIDEVLTKQDVRLGTFFTMDEIFMHFQEFLYVELDESKTNNKFYAYYKNVRGDEKRRRIPVKKIYQRYTADAPNFNFKDQTRRCLEED